MQLTITGYSTALFSTWYFIEELGLLFDAGEGLTSALLQKGRKINHAFISHADRDHLTGLLQFNQLNARPGFPIVHYPKDCGSFPAIETFTKKFDPHALGTVWKPIEANEEIWVRSDMFIKASQNSHIPTVEGVFKSFSYQVVQVKKKLKTHLAHLTGEEIKNLVATQGQNAVMDEVKIKLLSYSGDTPVENPERWHDSKVLIHEATFLTKQEAEKSHSGKHSSLEEVIEMVSNLTVEKLVLGHFSSRYNGLQIDETIRALCKKYFLSIPVYRILPGETVRDILNQKPVVY